MNVEYILKEMELNLSPLLESLGFSKIVETIEQYGPKIVFEKGTVNLIFRYDLKEKGFYFQKFNKAMPHVPYFYLSTFAKNNSNNNMQILLNPENECEMTISLQQWRKVIKENCHIITQP